MDLMEHTIVNLKNQKTLMCNDLNRLELLNLKTANSSELSFSVNVWRNHAFESVETFIKPFLSLRQASVKFMYSGYDDTLAFSNYTPAEVEIIWFDTSMLEQGQLANKVQEWLVARIEALRSFSSAPILVLTWFKFDLQSKHFASMVKRFSDIYFVDLKIFCDSENLLMIDQRTSALSGTLISNQASLSIARELGTRWLAALLFSPIKVIAIDLDNTLHQGVLGEDGVFGVKLTDYHKKLHSKLIELRKNGIFLALISRNEIEDVKKLFAQRKDYAINWDEFSATEVSWGSKAVAIDNVAKKINVGVESILFIDDNIGELLEVARTFPMSPQILAQGDGELTFNALNYFPGLWRWNYDESDAKRVIDQKGNIQREELSKRSLNEHDYLKSLGVTISAKVDRSVDSKRLVSLSNKTNQFNLAFTRLNEVELLKQISSVDYCVLAVSLKDVISDSGIIGLVIAKYKKKYILIEELCLSCRAMGRNLEDYVISFALKNIPKLQEYEFVSFKVVQGPRNQPAIKWLSEFLGNKKNTVFENNQITVSDILKMDVPKTIKTEVIVDE